jgi:Transposase, Mutator family
MAETKAKAKAQAAFDRFVAGFTAKYPKAVECLLKDREALLAFYDFPAEHWVHIRSTNVIESAFATIRHRSDQAKGCVSRDSMLSMVFQAGNERAAQLATTRGFEFLARVIAGVTFRDGLEQPLPTAKAAPRKRGQEHRRVAAWLALCHTPDLTIARRYALRRYLLDRRTVWADPSTSYPARPAIMLQEHCGRIAFSASVAKNYFLRPSGLAPLACQPSILPAIIACTWSGEILCSLFHVSGLVLSVQRKKPTSPRQIATG